MDNYWRGIAAGMHDQGLRAYLLPNDVHVYGDSQRYFPVCTPELWHALRAYQDEQRKKGVQINIGHDRAAQVSWYTMNVGEYHKMFTMENGKPVIEIFESYKPKKHKREARQTIAIFTNFRWRAGYPKPEFPYSNSAHELVHRMRHNIKPKGGQNG